MNTKSGIIAISLVILLITATSLIFLGKPQKPNAKTVTESAIEQDVLAESAETGIDLEKALGIRAIGDENAPVTMHEYASLTCSHCGSFHTENFKKLKENYFDTGKVYFVYHDFPLNAPALDAAMIARCLPEESYFKFLSFLFSTQDKWAYDANYQVKLEQNAKLLGLKSETFEACLKNGQLRAGILNKLKDAKQKYRIQSTPSFVFNGEEILSGNRPYKVFANKIDSLLEEAGYVDDTLMDKYMDEHMDEHMDDGHEDAPEEGTEAE